MRYDINREERKERRRGDRNGSIKLTTLEEAVFPNLISCVAAALAAVVVEDDDSRSVEESVE